MRVRHLKLLYALAGLLWTGYCSVELLAPHITGHVPITSGTLFCLLLFVSVPAFGYVLLFLLFPLAGRFLRR
jgi:bacteriorhodopsin